MSKNPDVWVPMNPFNQLAPRAYNRVVLCFEMHNEDHESAVQFLKSCVAKLGKKRPILTALLQTRAPIALLNETARSDIPVEVLDIRDKFGRTYSYLREHGFPASDFVNDVFEVPMAEIAHVLVIRIYLLDGGIIVGIHLNHLLGDGQGIDDVISWLSAETRGDTYDTNPIITEPPYSNSSSSSETDDSSEESQTAAPASSTSQRFPAAQELNCQAYTQDPAEECVIKNFLIDPDKLDCVRSRIEKYGGGKAKPSAVITLTALAWAHSIKARLAAFPGPGAGGDDSPSTLYFVVNVRKHAFDKARADQYFGNAVEMVTARVSSTELLLGVFGGRGADSTETITTGVGRASTDRDIIIEDGRLKREMCWDTMARHLEPLVRVIRESVAQIDAKHVRDRYRRFARLTDPSVLRLTHSRGDVRHFMVNSWRYLGLNPSQKWNIPGLEKGADGYCYPDKLCRAMGTCDFPAAMIMPTREGSGVIDLMVILERSAMEVLLKDRAFMSLVKEVIG